MCLCTLWVTKARWLLNKFKLTALTFGAPPTMASSHLRPQCKLGAQGEVAQLECVMNVHTNVYSLLKHNRALSYLSFLFYSARHLIPPFSPPAENMFELLISNWFISRPRATGDLGEMQMERWRELREKRGDGWCFDLSLWANYEHDPGDLRSQCLAFLFPLFRFLAVYLSPFWCTVTKETYTLRC